MPDTSTHFNAIIIGGGMVGLSLAALLVKHDFSVAIVEANPPTLHWQTEDYTARVSTIHRSTQRYLEYIGAWNSIDTQSKTPLQQMQVWDYAGTQLEFDSLNVGYPEMGWVVENRAIVKSLWQLLQQSASFFSSRTPCDLTIQSNCAALTLDDQTVVTADVIIGADGAHSWLRERMPISCDERPYYQKAITAVIASEKAHHNAAYQQFLATGPIALLPLTNNLHTALVWSANDFMSDELMQASDAEFNQQLSKALDYRLGRLKVLNRRHQFPLVMRHAEQYTSPHCALIGDAAHTIHPLAGQGANLGFMDAACLGQTLIDAKKAHQPLGAQRTLRRYTRWRKADNALMINAMCTFKNLFEINNTPFNTIRSIVGNTLNECHFLKNQFMQLAMGQSKDLPEFLL